MASVINRIRSWAKQLNYWEGLALEKIARGAVLSEQDKLELVEEFKRDAGLTPAVATRRPLSFPTGDAEESSSPDARLERLFNLSDVNALPAGQEIRFGPQITLIFGGNGAGKTGYARPLACAAFARGERAVLPNATQNPPASSPRADIEVRSGGRTQVVTWVSGRSCPELAGFYVFDANSLSAHLTRANTLAFAPSSLELLTRLAEITDEIRERLKRIIAEREVPHKFGSLFEGHSEVAEEIEGLGAETDLVALCELAKLSPEESAEMEVLEREITELKSRDTAKYIESRRQEVADLETLLSFVGRAERALAEPAEEVGRKLICELQAAREKSQKSGTDQFKLEALRQIGSESWVQFILAAKRLADAESARGEPYPGRGDHCLFCQQPLSDEALGMIQKIWAFLESDAQEQMRAGLGACERKIRDLSGLNLRYFEADSAARRLLASELPALVPSIEAQLDAFRERQSVLIACLESGEIRPLPPPIAADLTDIRTVVRNRRDQIAGLEASDTGERLKRDEKSLLVLRHRQTLGQHMGEIAAWVDQRRWALKARACLGTTRHITDKYNELFEELVAARYTDLFQETLLRFKAHVHLTIETYGQKGDRLRRISLSPAVFHSRYSVEQILSDGEKTAVAMADFLTEVRLL